MLIDGPPRTAERRACLRGVAIADRSPFACTVHLQRELLELWIGFHVHKRPFESFQRPHVAARLRLFLTSACSRATALIALRLSAAGLPSCKTPPSKTDCASRSGFGALNYSWDRKICRRSSSPRFPTALCSGSAVTHSLGNLLQCFFALNCFCAP